VQQCFPKRTGQGAPAVAFCSGITLFNVVMRLAKGTASMMHLWLADKQVDFVPHREKKSGVFSSSKQKQKTKTADPTSTGAA
jgi:hypothetical protein